MKGRGLHGVPWTAVTSPSRLMWGSIFLKKQPTENMRKGSVTFRTTGWQSTSGLFFVTQVQRLSAWRTLLDAPAWVWHESDKLSARPAGMSCTAICRHHRTSKNGIEAFTSYNRRIQQLEGSGPSSELLDPVNQRWGPILLPKFQLHFLIFNLLPKFLFHFQNFDHLRIYTALRLGYAHE